MSQLDETIHACIAIRLSSAQLLIIFGDDHRNRGLPWLFVRRTSFSSDFFGYRCLEVILSIKHSRSHNVGLHIRERVTGPRTHEVINHGMGLNGDNVWEMHRYPQTALKPLPLNRLVQVESNQACSGPSISA